MELLFFPIAAAQGGVLRGITLPVQHLHSSCTRLPGSAQHLHPLKAHQDQICPSTLTDPAGSCQRAMCHLLPAAKSLDRQLHAHSRQHRWQGDSSVLLCKTLTGFGITCSGKRCCRCLYSSYGPVLIPARPAVVLCSVSVQLLQPHLSTITFTDSLPNTDVHRDVASRGEGYL